MATIKEIAQLAGVSRGTVDRVLNHRGSVNPQTEAKILEIIKALDYRPNKAGLALAAQKKKLKFGVVMFGEGNPFFDDVMDAFLKVENELSEYNCTTLFRRTSSFGVLDQLDAIDALIKEGMNGLALAPQNHSSIANKINELYEMGIPTVTFNTDIQNAKRIAYVGSNYYKCGKTAANLMQLMCDEGAKIGIISGSPQILCHTERVAGFKDTLNQYKNYEIVEEVYNHDDDFESYELTKDILNKHPDIKALYFAAGGTYGGCKAVLSADLKQKLKIITYDKISSTIEMMKQGVISASICQQPKIQGTLPLHILFDYLTTGELPEKEINYTNVDIRILENL